MQEIDMGALFNNINVTIKGGALEIIDHSEINIDKNPKPQTIKWNLTGNIAKGRFLDPNGSPKGFEWITQPPPAPEIFDPPALGSNDNSLSIVDYHADKSSDGRWRYKLRACLDGKIYETEGEIRPPNTVNPIIINR